MRPLIATLVVWAAILLAPGARADMWVALASFGDAARAEAVRAQYNETLFTLDVVPASTPRGDVFRVVHGPVADRATAERLIDQARAAGFASPWIVHAGGAAAAGSAAHAAAGWNASVDGVDLDEDVEALLRSLDDDDDYLTTLSDYDDLPAYDSGAVQEDYVPVTRGDEELVQDAPESWGLNRLKR